MTIKMKNTAYILSLILLFFVVSCNIDNYDLPGETLQGKLTDASGNPYITEQPNGFQIRMIEEGSPQPRDFQGKPDGTFMNTKIFKGNYKILPINGAFFPVTDTVKTEISGVTTVDFKITPYATVKATIAANGKDLVATYRISKATGAGKISAARLLVNKWDPNLGMNYSDKSMVRTLSAIADETIVATDYTDQITGYLESGVTYYARIAVLATNSLGKYNFSTVQKIIVP
jgi:hypothetical protein